MDEWIRLVCKKCSTKLKIQPEHEGKRGKCPKCQTRCIIKEDDPFSLLEEEIGMDMDIDADNFDIEADLFAEFEAIDAAEAKKKGGTQVVKHNWDSGTKINMEELGL